MTADIITIGDEILIGQIIDTNSAWLAETLEQNGFKIRQITSISDQKHHIFGALNASLESSDLVILTGGLGPTDDDITKQSLAEYFNTKLTLNEELLSRLKIFVEARGLRLNERNRAQAMLPENCTLLTNDSGTAPGMWFEIKEKVVISMPGVPFEMKGIFTNCALPRLKSHFKPSEIIHRTVQTYGIPESNLAEQLAEWESALPKQIKLAYLPSPERLRLRMSMRCESKEKADAILDTETKKLEQIIGKAIFGYGDLFLQEALGNLLKLKNSTMATAESCTGGNISRLLTSIAGSSEYMKGGVVAYSNEIKERVLGVKTQTLIDFGAVSGQTVEEMAKGVLDLFQTDYAISVSGIAGPGGAVEGKPVGTVWIAIADKKSVYSRMFSFGNQRDINIRRATAKAMDMLRKFILYPGL